LVDLGGTLFYRTSDKDARGSKFDCKILKYMYFYRPGYIDFLTKLFYHPRINLVYYSSIMLKNIMPIMSNLLSSHSDLFELKKNLTIYDQDFCPLMREHPYMNNLKKETYERYRDL